MKKLIYPAVFLLLLAGCGNKSSKTAEDIASTVESGLAGVIGIVDEQGEQEIKDNYKAACDTSMRAANASCSSGVRFVNSTCEIGSLNVSVNVSLQYSESDCFVNANSESVTRTYTIERDTIVGGKVKVTSSSHTNYAGDTIAGGGRLTQTSGTTWSVDILGKRRTRTNSSNEKVVDISMKTSSTITISNDLTRANRNVNGGALDVYNNKAEYKATMVPNNVTYESGCCYPVGGTVDITYTGSVTGSATVTFNSCGKATVEKGDNTYSVTFYSCE